VGVQGEEWTDGQRRECQSPALVYREKYQLKSLMGSSFVEEEGEVLEVGWAEGERRSLPKFVLHLSQPPQGFSQPLLRLAQCSDLPP
jgi:hypothetical protein